MGLWGLVLDSNKWSHNCEDRNHHKHQFLERHVKNKILSKTRWASNAIFRKRRKKKEKSCISFFLEALPWLNL